MSGRSGPAGRAQALAELVPSVSRLYTSGEEGARARAGGKVQSKYLLQCILTFALKGFTVMHGQQGSHILAPEQRRREKAFTAGAYIQSYQC